MGKVFGGGGWGVVLSHTQSARMAVPKFVCEVACASGFASYMDDDVPWDTRSYVRKARPNSIALEKGNLGTHMRAKLLDSDFQS
jgi:hypothetical protein